MAATNWALSSRGNLHAALFLGQSVLILLAPALMLASTYPQLDRVTALCDDEDGEPCYSPISTQWVRNVYVTDEVVG